MCHTHVAQLRGTTELFPRACDRTSKLVAQRRNHTLILQVANERGERGIRMLHHVQSARGCA